MLIKCAGAVAIVFALFYFVGASELLGALAEIDCVYVFYLILIAVVMIWISCLKWRLFIRAHARDVSILHLMKLYTTSYFFNTFTPSCIGGDVARSYQLGKYLESQKDAFVSTFLERFTGVLAMSCLGLVFVVLGSQATAGIEIAVIIVGVLTLMLALMVFSLRISNFCFDISLSVLRSFGFSRLAARLDSLFLKLSQAMAVARGSRVLLAKAMLLSFAFHLMTVVNTYVAALAVGWNEPNVAGIFVIVPLVLLVSLVPLTPNALGVQEGAFLFFLEKVGATKAQGLGVGIVLRAKVILIAVVGGLLLVGLPKREVRASDMLREKN